MEGLSRAELEHMVRKRQVATRGAPSKYLATSIFFVPKERVIDALHMGADLVSSPRL